MRKQLDRRTLPKGSGVTFVLLAIRVMATAPLSNLLLTLLRALDVPADRFSASNGNIKEILV